MVRKSQDADKKDAATTHCEKYPNNWQILAEIVENLQDNFIGFAYLNFACYLNNKNGIAAYNVEDGTYYENFFPNCQGIPTCTNVLCMFPLLWIYTVGEELQFFNLMTGTKSNNSLKVKDSCMFVFDNQLHGIMGMVLSKFTIDDMRNITQEEVKQDNAFTSVKRTRFVKPCQVKDCVYICHESYQTYEIFKIDMHKHKLEVIKYDCDGKYCPGSLLLYDKVLYGMSPVTYRMVMYNTELGKVTTIGDLTFPNFSCWNHGPLMVQNVLVETVQMDSSGSYSLAMCVVAPKIDDAVWRIKLQKMQQQQLLCDIVFQ